MYPDGQIGVPIRNANHFMGLLSAPHQCGIIQLHWPPPRVHRLKLAGSGGKPPEVPEEVVLDATDHGTLGVRLMDVWNFIKGSSLFHTPI